MVKDNFKSKLVSVLICFLQDSAGGCYGVKEKQHYKQNPYLDLNYVEVNL